MTRIGRRLIEDFLLPALNEEKYGDLLKWIDKEKCYFSIRWSHKNAAKWTLADTAVFQDWDRLKGHYHPEIKGYYMQAKQRFRAALYKLNTVTKLPCEDKHVKKYQLVLNRERRHHEIIPRKASISRMPPYMHREDSQKSIPTPVICRNTSFIAKPEENFEEFSSNSPPSSPASSTRSEGSDDKVETNKCLEEYQLAQKSQRMHIKPGGYARVIPDMTRNFLDCPLSILRENPQMNMVRRTPHVPTQPVPVYSKCYVRQAVENSHKRVESPHVLLVRTYNDSDMDVDTIQTKVEIKEEMTEEYDDCNVEDEHNCENSEVALNLSTKCEDSETLSR